MINPDSALRCDCGYDFASGTVEKPYFTQELPKTIRNFLIFVIVWNAVCALLVLASGDVSRFVGTGVWMGVVYWSYTKLIQKKN